MLGDQSGFACSATKSANEAKRRGIAFGFVKCSEHLLWKAAETALVRNIVLGVKRSLREKQIL